MKTDERHTKRIASETSGPVRQNFLLIGTVHLGAGTMTHNFSSILYAFSSSLFFVLFCGVLSSWVLLHCVFVRSLFTQHCAVFYSIFARPLFEQEKEGERCGSCCFFATSTAKRSHASQKKNISTLAKTVSG